jgi:tape measure domain-containing protein
MIDDPHTFIQDSRSGEGWCWCGRRESDPIHNLADPRALLFAYGVPRDDLDRTVEVVEAAAAAGWAADVREMAEAIARVYATGRVSMEDVNRMFDRGIPLPTWDGLSEGEAREMIRAGRMSAAEFVEAIAAGVQ